MYLNTKVSDNTSQKNNWTLTWDVFKFLPSKRVSILTSIEH